MADFIRCSCNLMGEFTFFGEAAPQATIFAPMMRTDCLLDVGFTVQIALKERTFFCSIETIGNCRPTATERISFATAPLARISGSTRTSGILM